MIGKLTFYKSKLIWRWIPFELEQWFAETGEISNSWNTFAQGQVKQIHISPGMFSMWHKISKNGESLVVQHHWIIFPKKLCLKSYPYYRDKQSSPQTCLMMDGIKVEFWITFLSILCLILAEKNEIFILLLCWTARSPFSNSFRRKRDWYNTEGMMQCLAKTFNPVTLS